jgi:hypothetical protein
LASAMSLAPPYALIDLVFPSPPMQTWYAAQQARVA